MTMDGREAAEGLAAVRASRERLLAQAHWSWGRHAAFAGILSALVAGQALPTVASLVLVALMLLAVGAVVSSDRARKGVWINGWRAGRTRPYTVAMALLAAAAILLGGWLNREHELWWAPLVLAAGLFPLSLFGSKHWERVYRRELEESL